MTTYRYDIVISIEDLDILRLIWARERGKSALSQMLAHTSVVEERADLVMLHAHDSEVNYLCSWLQNEDAEDEISPPDSTHKQEVKARFKAAMDAAKPLLTSWSHLGKDGKTPTIQINF